MNDEPFYSPNHKPAPTREAKPGELLFEFVRASNQTRMFCELRNHTAPIRVWLEDAIDAWYAERVSALRLLRFRV